MNHTVFLGFRFLRVWNQKCQTLHSKSSILLASNYGVWQY